MKSATPSALPVSAADQRKRSTLNSLLISIDLRPSSKGHNRSRQHISSQATELCSHCHVVKRSRLTPGQRAVQQAHSSCQPAHGSADSAHPLIEGASTRLIRALNRPANQPKRLPSAALHRSFQFPGLVLRLSTGQSSQGVTCH